MECAKLQKIIDKFHDEGTLNPMCNRPAFAVCKDYQLTPEVRMTEREDRDTGALIRAFFVGAYPAIVKHGPDIFVLNSRMERDLEKAVLGGYSDKAKAADILEDVIHDLSLMKGSLVSKGSVINLLKRKIEAI